MGILGLTHSESGASLQRLPVVVKVAIGRGPDPAKGRKYPQRLDHFIFCRKEVRDAKDDQGKTVTQIAWVDDEEITKEITKSQGENPIEIGVIFLDDDPENVFKTSLAWWTQTECRCRGELVQLDAEGHWGMQANRKTPKCPDGELWPGKYHYTDGPNKGKPCAPCGEGCPDLEEGRCKPSGDLYFILAQFPMLGAICRWHTSSYRSIRNVANAIQQIRQVTGGRLAGMSVTLRVEPERISYEDAKGKHTTTAHIVSIRMDAPSMAKLLEDMTETAKLFQTTQKLLGGRTIQIVEDEGEIAPELTEEFHPENVQKKLPAETGKSAEAGTETEKAHTEPDYTKPPRAVIPDLDMGKGGATDDETQNHSPRAKEQEAKAPAPSNSSTGKSGKFSF
jgi:hypothetical protein